MKRQFPLLAGLALLVCACACLPLVSDWALAGEEGKLVEHDQEKGSYLQYDQGRDAWTQPRQMRQAELAVVDRGRQALMAILGDDPAQPGYVATMRDAGGDGDWITVTWSPVDMDLRLLDPQMDMFLEYTYCEKGGAMALVDVWPYGADTHIMSVEMNRALDKQWRRDVDQEDVALTDADLAAIDRYHAQKKKLDARFEAAKPRMRQLADEMIAKLGLQGAAFLMGEPYDGDSGPGMTYSYQLPDGRQAHLMVNLALDRVSRVEYEGVARRPGTSQGPTAEDLESGDTWIYDKATGTWSNNGAQ